MQARSDRPPGPVGIVGAGRVGAALARALYERGVEIAAVISRSIASAERCAQRVRAPVASDRVQDLPEDLHAVFLTPPEGALETVVTQLLANETALQGAVVMHTSGALTSEILQPLGRLGVAVGCLHPIQTFAGHSGDWQRLSNIFFGIEGEPPAVAVCKGFVELLGSRWVLVPREFKPLYHVACVFAANYLVALLDVPMRLFGELRLSESDTARLLRPLVEAAVRNTMELGPTGALTGPIARGDAETVRHHLEALKPVDEEVSELYRALGRRALALARRKGAVAAENLAILERWLNPEV